MVLLWTKSFLTFYLKSENPWKKNSNRITLRPPTSLYTHFRVSTLFTFMFAMVMRAFCAPHILSKKIFIYVFFCTKNPLRGLHSSKYAKSCYSMMCFLFILTFLQNELFPEVKAWKKISTLICLHSLQGPISPGVVNPGWED